MDDLDEETPRDFLSRREKRWSMSSSRLEEIVAELMRPIGDLRHSFDTDISALLEEYLTQAGLHALDEGAECDPGGESGGSPVPNFPELALLLQHSASVYSRKVDCLYQRVLAVSDSLQTASMDDSQPLEHDLNNSLGTPSARRKRKSSATNDFSLIPLETSNTALREGGYAPPPVLARGLVGLEPRVLRPRDVQLLDYTGEPIGLIQDYHLTRPLTDGGLVPCSMSAGGALRGVPLHELQAAIEAAAPPALPPAPPAPPSQPSQPSPTPPLGDSCEMSTMPPPAVSKVQRKRKSDVTLDEITGNINFTLSKASLRKLRRTCEFRLPTEWIYRVVSTRHKHIRAQRDSMHHATQLTEFPGWSSEESLAATARVSLQSSATVVRTDSDDDGFFEHSSSGDSDLQTSGAFECEWSWWAASVARRADTVPAMDVTHAATSVLCAALPHEGVCSIKEAPHAAVPFASVLRRAATHHTDVSRLFLATLFLANSGNVDIVPGAALTLDSFSVRVVTADASLYSATLAHEVTTKA